MKINKKGAVATTMTWVIATIVIFFVIILFLFISGALGAGGIGKKEVAPLRFPEQQQSLFAIARDYDENVIPNILSNFPKSPSGKSAWKLSVIENENVIKSFEAPDAISILGFHDAQNFYSDLTKDSKTQLRLFFICEETVCYDELE